jgi:SAM-dependent methyltransferase
MGSIRKETIRQAIREKYAGVAGSIEGRFRYPTGKAGAAALGYDPKWIESAPHAMVEMFCGLGNPFSMGEFGPGQTVLDLGCGAGFDLFCAAKMTGPQGRLHGVDLSYPMAKKAKENLRSAGMSNVAVHVAGSETIPFIDGMFDVVISNGVLNLSPEKEGSFRELIRVLKPGGRLQFADMVLKETLPPEEMDAKAWSE